MERWNTLPARKKLLANPASGVLSLSSFCFSFSFPFSFCCLVAYGMLFVGRVCYCDEKSKSQGSNANQIKSNQFRFFFLFFVFGPFKKRKVRQSAA